MRLLILPALLLPLPLNAETVEVVTHPDRVTVYPRGASVERVVPFDAPAGEHKIVLPGFPEDLELNQLRISAPEGVTIGAVTLSSERQPVTVDVKSAEVTAAEDEVDRLEEALAKTDDAIAAIRLKVEAADAQVGFLNRMRAGDGTATATPEEVRALLLVIGDEVAKARQNALAAGAEIRAAEKARKDDVEALEKARQSLAALTDRVEGGRVLTVSVVTSAPGPASLNVTTFTENAAWVAVYDLRLTRGETPSLQVERGAGVFQGSGEDWTGVELVLSTAVTNGHASNWGISSQQVAIISEEELRAARADDSKAVGMGGMAAPVMEPEPVVEYDMTYTMNTDGITVTYQYPTRVDIRDGADALRLSLDQLALTPRIFAEAIPMQEEVAFLMAEITNSTPEILLPGSADVYVDGALRGKSDLPLIAAGDTADIGFGQIEGIRLKRTVPNRSAGDRGLIAKSNAQEEVATIEVKNLTGEDWPLRLIDRVPYSEQDDLVVTYTATPPETEHDWEGQRGILMWDLNLKAGETQEIKLEHSLSWPSGWVLR
ncbi:MAG: mucoidy inhibitor MuiA family protein [Albidovulum sp.]